MTLARHRVSNQVTPVRRYVMAAFKDITDQQMKTRNKEWGYDIVIPLVGYGWLLGYALYQFGVSLWLVYTFATVAYCYIALKYDQ